MQTLKEYDFHDKYIKDICIHSNKDFIDEVIIDLFDENGNLVKLKFVDCVFCNINGKGWIAGRDSIREWIIEEGEEIKDLTPEFVEEKHKKQLKYIKFNLNTSNSTIEILARKILFLQE